MRRRTKEALKTAKGKKEKNDLTSHPVEACIHYSVLQATGLRTRRAHLPQIPAPLSSRSPLAVGRFRAIDDGLHNTVNNPARKQADGDAVAGLVLAFWLLAGHGGNVRLLGARCLLNAKPLARRLNSTRNSLCPAC